MVLNILCPAYVVLERGKDVLALCSGHEVIEWAEREAGPDACYTLFVRFESPYGRGMVHIAGLDPSVRPEQMTFRRRHPLRRNSELSPDSHE